MMQRKLGGVAAILAVVTTGACVSDRPSDAGQWTDPPRRLPPGSEPANPAASQQSAPSAATAPAGSASGDALAAQVERDLEDLNAALAEREAARQAAAQTAIEPSPVASAPRPQPSSPAVTPVSPVIEGQGGVASANVEEAIDTGMAPLPTTAEALPLPERIQRLSSDLAASLEQAAVDGDERALVALGALEALHEGALREEALAGRSADAAEAWRAWAAMHRDAARRAEAGETDAGLAAAKALLGSASAASLSVDTALLCSRVEGYGRYQPLDARAILAGRGQRAIVYAEVSGFSHRATSNDQGEPGWMVELTQELSLYHDADQVLAWRRPEQVISDFSRNKRRDFFVVQMIELPPTLSIGAYNLKITMRDREGGAVAEAIIPLRVVADPALTRNGR